MIGVIDLRSRATLAEQLSPFAARMRVAHPTIRHVVQVTAFLGGSDPKIAAQEARQQTLRWLQKRAGPLPQQAWAGESFEKEIPGQHASAVSLFEPPYWVARLDHPDGSVPGRTWSTEITVGMDGARSQFGVRLRCSSRDHDPDPELTIPGIVRQVADRPGLEDNGIKLSPEAWILKDRADVERMVRLLENPARHRPVYLASLPHDRERPEPALFDVEDLATRCIGIAYVIVLSSPLSFELTDIVGREHSVFGGAVRSYMPGFTVQDQLPFKHPLALADRISDWPSGGPATFADMLVRKAHEWSVRTPDLEKKLPTYSFVRRLALERRDTDLDSERNAEIRLANLKGQISELRRDNEDWVAEVDQLIERAEITENERDNLRSENGALRFYVDHLRHALQQSGNNPNVEIPFPIRLIDMPKWAQQTCPGRLILTSRAVRGLKEGRFQNVTLACQSLLLLANEYRDMRLSLDPEAKIHFENARTQLKLECTPTFAGTGWGEFGDTYVVEWNGQKRKLEMHLKNGGNTRTPERCLRVYFFWDDVEQQIVVGWLPGHLETRLT